MSSLFPKVLIASPTSKSKDYCFDEWIDNVFSFKYPNYDVVVFDNTSDGGSYSNQLNERVCGKYGKNRIKFKAYNSLKIHGVDVNSIHMKLTMSHNDCRDFFLGKDYQYMLHLESDVFPPKDVIERLIFHNKHIVGAGYHIYDGKKRTLLVYNHLELAPNRIMSKVSTTDDDILLMNGDCISVAQVGLGCTLLSRFVLQKISFRFEPEESAFPDTYFTEDCHQIGVGVFCDTSFICRHENRTWGIKGLDYT
jgi:hypothetical protein